MADIYGNETLYIGIWFESEQDAAEFAEGGDYPISCIDGDRVVISPIVPPGAARSIYADIAKCPGVVDYGCY